MGCDEDRRNPGHVPGALGAHAAEARTTTGALSRTWCCAGWRHAGLAAGAQREPDWAEVEAEAGRAGEEAEEDGEVAERVLGGVLRLFFTEHSKDERR